MLFKICSRRSNHLGQIGSIERANHFKRNPVSETDRTNNRNFDDNIKSVYFNQASDSQF